MGSYVPPDAQLGDKLCGQSEIHQSDKRQWRMHGNVQKQERSREGHTNVCVAGRPTTEQDLINARCWRKASVAATAPRKDIWHQFVFQKPSQYVPSYQKMKTTRYKGHISCAALTRLCYVPSKRDRRKTPSDPRKGDLSQEEKAVGDRGLIDTQWHMTCMWLVLSSTILIVSSCFISIYKVMYDCLLALVVHLGMGMENWKYCLTSWNPVNWVLSLPMKCQIFFLL